MSNSEFALIDRYFRSLGAIRADVIVGVGDDGAVLRPPDGHDVVAVLDTIVAGRHFPRQTAAASIAHRALAVNLSDLAAMAAQPAWMLLSLTMERADTSWLDDFAAALDALALRFGVALVGGDTVRGPLAITVQASGFVPTGRQLTRSGARPGDLLYVSGTLGDAAAGLAIAESAAASLVTGDYLRRRFDFPEPRVELGLQLRDFASACIDVSDGLFADLSRMAASSGCGAELELMDLPLSGALLDAHGRESAQRLAMTGGDDYELCFAVPPQLSRAFERLAKPCQVTRIGQFVTGEGVVVRSAGAVIEFSHSGFDHFTS
ncbi:MAG: thiamine-phosphate kinase [Steroidobacteraceae bacterium]